MPPPARHLRGYSLPPPSQIQRLKDIVVQPDHAAAHNLLRQSPLPCILLQHAATLAYHALHVLSHLSRLTHFLVYSRLPTAHTDPNPPPAARGARTLLSTLLRSALAPLGPLLGSLARLAAAGYATSRARRELDDARSWYSPAERIEAPRLHVEQMKDDYAAALDRARTVAAGAKSVMAHALDAFWDAAEDARWALTLSSTPHPLLVALANSILRIQRSVVVIASALARSSTRASVDEVWARLHELAGRKALQAETERRAVLRLASNARWV
ncbi:hypothetical protein JCM10207_001615 [Rhodosporidiobolus poonsookiae]